MLFAEAQALRSTPPIATTAAPPPLPPNPTRRNPEHCEQHPVAVQSAPYLAPLERSNRPTHQSQPQFAPNSFLRFHRDNRSQCPHPCQHECPREPPRPIHQRKSSHRVRLQTVRQPASVRSRLLFVTSSRPHDQSARWLVINENTSASGRPNQLWLLIQSSTTGAILSRHLLPLKMP